MGDTPLSLFNLDSISGLEFLELIDSTLTVYPALPSTGEIACSGLAVRSTPSYSFKLKELHLIEPTCQRFPGPQSNQNIF